MSGFSYLATVYSKHPYGVEIAYTQACTIAASLFKQGISVYSPIAHCHGIAKAGGFGTDFNDWTAFDEAMIAASDGVIVAKMDGWKDSSGIAAEIVIAKRLGKPVTYVDTE